MPISPPLDSLPYNQGPKNKKGVVLPFLAIIFSTLITAIIALVQLYLQLPKTYLLILLPIWLLADILIYSYLKKN
ncbi:MAG: hypothetical protein WCW26_04925 [Candidatus Buchananbacteria bacterium]